MPDTVKHILEECESMHQDNITEEDIFQQDILHLKSVAANIQGTCKHCLLMESPCDQGATACTE